MEWSDNVLTRLAGRISWGYHEGSHAATEPTALAALALTAHGRDSAAAPMLDWLLTLQNEDGSLGIDGAQQTPGWATGLAVLAWKAGSCRSSGDRPYDSAIERALSWMLGIEGSIVEKIAVVGHDVAIKGWPWVVGTHAWIEPTAINLLALKNTGHGSHPRAVEATDLLRDRLLSTGGCNYGNTTVFGQELRAHVQPTGLALLALRGASDRAERIARSVDYLHSQLTERTTTGSLCYALLGLAAHDAWPTQADSWLAAAARRTIDRDASAYKLALVSLAGLGPKCPLVAHDEAVARSAP